MFTFLKIITSLVGRRRKINWKALRKKFIFTEIKKKIGVLKMNLLPKDSIQRIFFGWAKMSK